MEIETKPFDAAKYISTSEDVIALINDAVETGHAGYIAAALGIAARAKGMSSVAADAGLNRQALYTALKESGNPTLDTFVKVLEVLDLRMKIERRKQATA